MKKLLSLLSIFTIVLSCSPETFNISFSAGEGGTVSTKGGEYEAGQTVTVSATPLPGYIFKSWSDGDTNSTRSIEIASETTLTAIFIMAISADEVYSQIIDGPDRDEALKSFVSAFIKDAERHGVDISHVNVDTAKMQWWDEKEDEGISAGSYFSCNPTEVFLRWSGAKWSWHPLSDDDIDKLLIMWHELGHDILGLAHTCEGGQIMSGRHSACRGPELPIDREYKTVNYMTFDNEDPYLNFQRAVDDMFAGNRQYYVECRTSFTSKGDEDGLIIN